MPEDQPTAPPSPFPASAPPPPPQAYTPPYAPPSAQPYAQPAPYPIYGLPPRPRRSGWFWVAVIGGSFAVIALLITAMVWSITRSITGESTDSFDGLGGSRIGVIDIDGVILDADQVNT